MKKEKKILVFAGPSGVGKSTLSNMLLNKYPDNFSFAISATTRPMRVNEIHGKDYYFLSEEDFQKKIEKQEFIEWEEVYAGRFYGTLSSEIDRINELGKKTILDIDVLGALNIKKMFGDSAQIIFVKTESLESLTQRLRERKTDSEEDIQIRIDRFSKELALEEQFDSVIVNKTNDLKGSEQQLKNILINNFFDIDLG